MDKKPLAVWGASGHALVVADILRLRNEYEIVGFLDNIDPGRRGDEFGGSRILGGEEQLPILLQHGIQNLILGFGNCQARIAISQRVQKSGFTLAIAIHPRAIISSDVQIGLGTVIAAGAVINPRAIIGENVIINTSSSVDHDCVIKNGAHISPGAHIGGHTVIGQATWVGIGATVIDHIQIGDATMIGAGAVVVRDIPDNVVAYGNPAKIMLRNSE